MRHQHLPVLRDTHPEDVNALVQDMVIPRTRTSILIQISTEDINNNKTSRRSLLSNISSLLHLAEARILPTPSIIEAHMSIHILLLRHTRARRVVRADRWVLLLRDMFRGIRSPDMEVLRFPSMLSLLRLSTRLTSSETGRGREKGRGREVSADGLVVRISMSLRSILRRLVARTSLPLLLLCQVLSPLPSLRLPLLPYRPRRLGP